MVHSSLYHNNVKIIHILSQIIVTTHHATQEIGFKIGQVKKGPGLDLGCYTSPED